VVAREARLATVRLELGCDALRDGAQTLRVPGRRLEPDQLSKEI
jgi:hypothetical protein